MASPPFFPVESLVAGRQRRSTAGNRLASLLHQEADKDDTLFMEDESDVEFEEGNEEGGGDGDDGDGGAALSDVQFSSEDEDEEEDGKTGGGEGGGVEEDPELEGERELQKAEREEKKAQRKKQQDIFLKPKAVPKRKVVVAVQQEESRVEGTPTSGADDTTTFDGVDTSGFEMINGRPRKKSERISWVPEVGPVRQSSRSLAVANKERTIQRLEESEKRRLQIIAQMEAAKQRQGGRKKKKEMTQAERLEEAKITERRNLRSLNRWEEAENQRAEARRERLAALHGQRITGPVVRYWSGKAEWNGEGTLVKMGKILLEEKAKQREEEKKKARGGRRKTAKEKEEEARAAANEAKEKSTEAGIKPVDEAVGAEATSATPTGTAPDVVQPAAVADLTNKDVNMIGNDTEPTKDSVESIEKVVTPPNRDTESVERQVGSTDMDVTMEDASEVTAAPVAAAPVAHIAPVARITPPRPLIQLIEDDIVEPKAEMIESSDIPSIKAPTVEHSKGGNSEPLRLSPLEAPKEPVQEEARNTQDTQEPEEAQAEQQDPKPTPTPQPPQYGVRNVVILEDFDPPMTWEATNRFLFPNNIAAVRRDKSQTEICPITSEVAKYRDPTTGVHYASLRAFKEIQKVRAGTVRWCQMFGCYVGPTNDAASGVPEGFF